MDFVKANLADELRQVKGKIVSSVVVQTSKFLNNFNQSATLLLECNFTCVDTCLKGVRPPQYRKGLTFTSEFSHRTARLSCLDKCYCYSPQIFDALQAQSLTGAQEGEELGTGRPIPYSSQTLQRIASRLSIEGRNTTEAELQQQIKIARQLYGSEL